MARKNNPTIDQKPEINKISKAQDCNIAIGNSEGSVNGTEELDVTKDNLRLFVERWREHPDSPYMIEVPQTLGKINASCDHDETISLRAQSPSPRESLCSSPSETMSNSPRENRGFFLNVPTISLAYERRASEGTAAEKARDPASQIVLAEEIIRLSEHLRSIATIGSLDPNNDDNNVVTNGDDKNLGILNSTKIIDQDKSRDKTKLVRPVPQMKNNNKSLTLETNESNEITEKLSSITRQRKLNGTTFHSSRSFDRYNETNSTNVFSSFRRRKSDDKVFMKNEEHSVTEDNSNTTNLTRVSENTKIISNKSNEMDLTPPWRRTRVKHSFGETSRDVPRISNLRDLHKSLNLDEPADTKDLLLHLLGEWEEVGNRTSTLGRKSVSIDWCGEESVARKTLNSLAEYFQSKQQKSSTNNVAASTSPPIYR